MGQAQIATKIAALKKELAEVKGTECEVYARIVGYYRSVKNWNKGKASEYQDRVNFDMKAAS